MPAHFIAWKHALKTKGATFDFTWDLFLSRAGVGMIQTVEELAVQFGEELDPEEVVKEQRRAFKVMDSLLGGVEEVVEFAKELYLEFPMTVASGSSRESVERSLEQLGIRNLFSGVFTPESVEKGRGKPHPDMFLLAAKSMGVEGGECLVLEDGAAGIEAAKRGGMDCAIVKCVKPSEEKLRELSDYLVAHLEE